jgi:hypothetical protein
MEILKIKIVGQVAKFCEIQKLITMSENPKANPTASTMVKVI